MRIATFVALSCILFSSPVFAQQESDKQPNQIEKSERAKSQGDRMRRGRRGQQGQSNSQLKSFFKRMDQNQDGVLSPDEVPERMQQRLKRIDLDQSGTVTLKELSAAFQSRSQGQNGMARGMRGRGFGDMKNSGKKGSNDLTPEETVQFMLKRMDKDGNGEITADEVPERMKNNFGKLDKNGNDVLDKNEIVAMIEVKKAEGGKKNNRYDTNRETTKGQMPKRPPRGG